MPRQSITFTSPNHQWLESCVRNEEYASKSEAVNDLIRRARKRDEELEEIRAALVEGERSGLSDSSVDEIWEEARKRPNG